ncbi:MAG TPA: GNAT family N-acetyltransferase [Allosphingosinicella sp.]
MPDQLSKEEVEALREMAANRGCRLVRSRRRKPGGDFGRLGLADLKSGKQVFGFGGKGLEATPQEVATFLRGSMTSTWKKSLAAAGKAGPSRPASEPKAKAPAKTPAEPKRRRAPAPEASPPRPKAQAAAPRKPAPAPPALRIRRADAVDGEAIAPLLAELGYEVGSDDLADRIGMLSRMGEPVLVAKLGDAVVGCLTWHVVPVIQRPRPVGRITMLVVTGKARRRGVGRALVEAAETRLRQRGCGLVEVTSNVKLRGAHAFYEHLGFERTSHRFAKPLETNSS